MKQQESMDCPLHWLVSVRNLDEMTTALAFDVDIIDFKEPRLGALSPVAVEIWNGADRLRSETIGRQRMTLSAALGERDSMLQVAEFVPEGFSYAKVGPSGCDDSKSLSTLWNEATSRLHDSTQLVAVAYADFQRAGSVDPLTLFQLAHQAGIRYGLVDTFTKQGQTLLDFLPIEELRELNHWAREHGFWLAMAGSITRQVVESISQCGLEPDCFGVRGDVCYSSRDSGLCEAKLSDWQKMIGGLRTSRSQTHSNPF